MIFVKNKTNNTHAKLGQSLGVTLSPKKSENDNEKFVFNKLYSNEVNKFRRPVIKKTNKLIRSGRNAISQKQNHLYNLTSGDFKNDFYSMSSRGYTPYDPYLINACKEAIIHVKKELPNYRDIINKINNEFGIVDETDSNTQFINYNKTCRSFSKNNFAFTKYSNNYNNNNYNNTTPKFYHTLSNDLSSKINDIETKNSTISPKGNE